MAAVGLVFVCGSRSVTGAPQLIIRPRTPQLVGPDTIEPAPVLVLSKQRAELDGRPMTPDELEKTLGILANNWKILNPSGTWGGNLIVACEPEVDTPRLGEYLTHAQRTGYPNASFLFVIRYGDGTSPARDRMTGANAEIVTAPARTARARTFHLKLGKHANCLSLSQELVAHRQQGDAVLLDVGRPPPEPIVWALPMDAAPIHDVAAAPKLRASVRALAQGSDPLEVTASAQMDHVINVRHQGVVFTVGYDKQRLITYIATIDPHFSTTEGIRVGSSLSQVRAAGAKEPWAEPGWAFHTKLPSAWNAAFVQGPGNTEGKLEGAAAVRWLFKRQRGSQPE